MKRLILLVLLSMLLVLALSACGGSADEPVVEETAVEDLECTDELGCVEVAPGDPNPC